MADTDVDFSGFISAYISYFGYEPVVRKKGAREIKIASCAYKIPVTCIPQITKFYNLRLGKGLTHKDPLDDSDFLYLQEGMESKSILRLAAAVCLQVSYDRFGYELRYNGHLTLQQIEYKIKNSSADKTEFTITWDGKTQTMHQWAAEVGITVVALRRRYKEYGVCALLFMSREDFKIHNSTYAKLSKFDPETVGTAEWRALSSSEPAARLEKFDIPLKNATALIITMVQDAIDNIEKRNKKYFHDSVTFLTNRDGYIQWLFDAFPECDAHYLISELQSKYSKYLQSHHSLQSYPNHSNGGNQSNAYI